MTREDLVRLHSDPANWKLGIFYFCRDDRRILVPKRLTGLGWTLNFARPMAVPFILATLALIWGILALARHAGVTSETYFVIKLLLAVGIIAFCYGLAHRPAKITEADPEKRDP